MRRAGLVTTNSIRGGASRKVLDPIADADAIWEAWADEPWVLDGAAVRVSMLGFGQGFVDRRLDGEPVPSVTASLTNQEIRMSSAGRLSENASRSFIGTQKNGEFDIDGNIARLWLQAPLNPNGRPNSDVIRPSWLGTHVTSRWNDTWIIYFPTATTEADAALYERPFQHVVTHVQPVRFAQRRETRRLKWWLLGEPLPALRAALDRVERFIATPRVSKHRVFVWLSSAVLPDCQLVSVARDDDTTFGILHSRFHELWSLRMGTSLEDRPRYTPSTTFETFPFPEGLTPNIPAADYADDPRTVAIAEAARDLNAKREAWLNPADLVRIEPEVVPGYPDRILPVSDEAAKVLKTRTLTNLYNQRPEWLAMAHRRLDAAVAAAYGWPADLSDDAVLEQLFALNQERAAAGR